MTHIELDGLLVEVIKKKIRYLHLTVHPPMGRVRISAPLRMSARSIRAFAMSKLDWIRRQQRRLQAQGRPARYAYVEGESHDLWGEPHLLTVIERDAAPRVAVADGALLLQVRPGSSVEQRRAVMTAWHRALLDAAAPPLVARWEPVLGVEVRQLSVRRMKTRWGSCSPRSGRIRLSTELVPKPSSCLEYVIVHEMVHLLEPSHNRRFVALMDRFLPGWRLLRMELNRVPARPAPAPAVPPHWAPTGQGVFSW